jgi:hypothetical protein
MTTNGHTSTPVLTTHEATVQLAAVMERLPTLTSNGMGMARPWTSLAPSKDAGARAFAEERAYLLSCGETFGAVCSWLEPIPRNKTASPALSSYFLKHLAEDCLGVYILNGVFIAAAVHCGFRYKEYPDSPNVGLGISRAPLREALKRANVQRMWIF